MRQHLLIDADDTLWENNIYFEHAIHAFIEFLNHSRLSPTEVRAVLDEAERLMRVRNQNFRMYPDDQHLLIIRSVEDANAPAFGQCGIVESSPEFAPAFELRAMAWTALAAA